MFAPGTTFELVIYHKATSSWGRIANLFPFVDLDKAVVALEAARSSTPGTEKPAVYYRRNAGDAPNKMKARKIVTIRINPPAGESRIITHHQLSTSIERIIGPSRAAVERLTKVLGSSR